MGRPRQYGSDAERQRAYRQRDAVTTARVDRVVLERQIARLDRLHAAVAAAAQAGDGVARACRAGSIETLLEKLTDYFESCRPGADARAGSATGCPSRGVRATPHPSKRVGNSNCR